MEPFFFADKKLTVPSGMFSGATEPLALTAGEVLDAYVQRVLENQQVLLNIKGKLLAVHLPKEAQVGDTLALRVATAGANITLELLTATESKTTTVPRETSPVPVSEDAISAHLQKLGAPDTPQWRQAAQALLKYQQPLDARHLNAVMQSADGIPEKAGAAAFLLSKELPPTPALVRATADLLSTGVTLARDLSQAQALAAKAPEPALRELAGLLGEIAQDADTSAGLEKLLKDFGGGKITEVLARIEANVAEKLSAAPAMRSYDDVLEGLSARLENLSAAKTDAAPWLAKNLSSAKLSPLASENPTTLASALLTLSKNPEFVRSLSNEEFERIPKLLNALTQTLVDKATAGEVPSALWNDLPDEVLKQVVQKLPKAEPTTNILTPAASAPKAAPLSEQPFSPEALSARLQQILQTRAEADAPEIFVSKLMNPPEASTSSPTTPTPVSENVAKTTEVPSVSVQRAVESFIAQQNSAPLSRLGAEELTRLLQLVAQSDTADLTKLFPLLSSAVKQDQLSQELIKLLSASLPQLSGDKLPAQLLNGLPTPMLETLLKQLPEVPSPGTSAAQGHSAARDLLTNAIAARQTVSAKEPAQVTAPFSAELLRQELLSRLDRPRVEALYESAKKMERSALEQQSDLGSWRSLHQSLQSAADKVAAYKAMTFATPEVVVAEIPLRLGQGEGSALLKISYRREGKERKLSREPVQIALVLDMSELGGILGEFKVSPNAVNGSVKLENEDAVRFLQEHSDELEEGLRAAGFQPAISFLKEVIPPRASLLDDRSEPPPPDDLQRLDVKI